jgi:hypothetical protein
MACVFGFIAWFATASFLLPLVFTFAEAFIDLEASILRVRDRQRLELVRRGESGNDFAHRLLARRTIRERLGRQRTVQRELPAAHLAVAFAQFVFVNGHESNFQFQLQRISQ